MNASSHGDARSDDARYENSGTSGSGAVGTDHESVGAYALGLLTPAECDVFEAHLVGCDRCGEELEALMGIAEVMPVVAEPSAVSVSSVPAAAKPVAGHDVVGAAAGVSVGAGNGGTARENVESDTAAGSRASGGSLVSAPSARPNRTRRLFALAAGFVLLAIGALGGVVGQEWASDEPSRSPGNATAQGLGPGERVTAVDPTTGLEATAALTTKGWGTNVVLQLSKLRGPLTCTLVAVKRDGTSETAMTWAVPPKGYGTPEQPNPLLLSGGSSIVRDQLDRFEVRDADGRVLVTLPA